MIVYNLSYHNTSNMEKLEYEDGTLAKHVETFVRQKLSPKEVLRILEDENMDEIADG